MSKADEMFEELEYTKQETFYKSEPYEIHYRKNGEYSTNIEFNTNHKCILFYRKEGQAGAVSMEILQAINKKVKELGWS